MDLVHYNLGRLADERGDEAGASSHYQAAYDFDRNNFLACLNLGNAAALESRRREAITSGSQP